MTLDRPAMEPDKPTAADEPARVSELGATYPTPPGDTVRVAAYAVGQIAAYLRELLDTDPVVGDLWVAGEVRNFSRSQAEHLYFTLRDADGALACAFFRRENRGVRVEEGDQVLVHGRVSLWEERGDLQLYVDALQPEGVGTQQAELERLRRKLEVEGLFDPGRKRALPDYPHTVGVVTSPAGAVWHDIQTVLGRRWPPAALLLAPCQVQGDGAGESITWGIEALNDAADAGIAPVDVIIVARGGGSMEDLAAFNSEAVARAAYASALPVVSAVGHETDYTLIDYVADVRAPTPSAAAEMVAPNQEDESTRLWEQRGALGRALAEVAEAAQLGLDADRERLEATLPDVDGERLRIDALTRAGTERLVAEITGARAVQAAHQGRLAALNPTATLARGYAIVEDAKGRVRTRAEQLSVEEAVRLRFADGAAGARVTDVDLTETGRNG